MKWPSRQFWQRLGFDIQSSDEYVTVYIPGWASLLAVCLLIRWVWYLVDY